MAPLPDQVRMKLKMQHALQLSGLIPSNLEDIPEDDTIPAEPLGTIVDWIENNSQAIAAARDAACKTQRPDEPNWNISLFTIVESAGVYNRNEREIQSAIEAAKRQDWNAAVGHIDKSQETINEVAKALDCTFIQLCDFAHQSPEGSWLHSGAYCGLFISNQAKNAFMGVTYKGSSNYREAITDLDSAPSNPLVPDAVWGAQIHSGFNKGLFGIFRPINDTAFNFMMQQLGYAYDQHKDKPMLHFTGHSLGGAYATLTFGEFLRQIDTEIIKKYRFGDMHTFGAPRVCLPPFYNHVNEFIHPNSIHNTWIFRIVNGAEGNQDPVTTIPPATSSGPPYIHVGGAYRLRISGPEKMRDEPPQFPPSLIVKPWTALLHRLSSYYDNWMQTPHA